MHRRALSVAALGLALPVRALEGGLLRVSYNEDYAPYSFVEAPGAAVQGVLPQAIERLTAALGLRTEALGLPWRRAQMAVQSAEADAICTFASEERRAYALFGTQPVVTLEPHLFFRADHPRRRELEQLNERAVLRTFHLVDQRGNQWGESQFGDFPQVSWVGGHDAIYRMVLAGRVDLHVALSPLVTQWRLRKLGLQAGVVSVPAPYVAPAVPFHLGIRRSHPQAEAWIHAIDTQLALPAQRQQIRAIEQQYR